MKEKTILFCITLFFCMMVCSVLPKTVMAAQVNGALSIEGGVEEQYLVVFLEALEHKDKGAAGKIWHNSEDESRNASMDTIFEIWDGRDIASYTKLGEEFRPESKKLPEGMNYHYQLERENETIQIEFGMNSAYGDEPKMDSFRFTITPKPVGSLATWRLYNPAQWLMALLAVCEIVFSFYVALLCIKERPKFWILWVLFILAAYGGVALTLTGHIQVGAFVYTFFMPKIIIYSSIGVQIFLSLPIGAIIYYWCSKKKKKGKRRKSNINGMEAEENR